jgi:hypothetical protein
MNAAVIISIVAGALTGKAITRTEWFTTTVEPWAEAHGHRLGTWLANRIVR